jgi:hypothetical protein
MINNWFFLPPSQHSYKLVKEKINIIALSTTIAKYVSTFKIMNKIIWLYRFLGELTDSLNQGQQ